MPADIQVIDPLGDLIITIKNPNNRELVADIVLDPLGEKQEANAAKRRRI